MKSFQLCLDLTVLGYIGDQLLFISFDVKVKNFWGASGKGWAESVHLGWNNVN